MKSLPLFTSLLVAAAPAVAGLLDQASEPLITGKYLEVRSCDVYTGPCFANAEMGLNGKEAVVVWSIDNGAWEGIDLSGLNVIAVVRTEDTLGDIKYAEPNGNTVLILDETATATQQAALAAFARSTASKLIGEIIGTHRVAIETTIGSCTKSGSCASVKAGKLVHISTRCFCDEDHVCGNEYLYYPPLTVIDGATAAFAEKFSFQGRGLGVKWATTGLRGAYVGSFTQ